MTFKSKYFQIKAIFINLTLLCFFIKIYILAYFLIDDLIEISKNKNQRKSLPDLSDKLFDKKRARKIIK